MLETAIKLLTVRYGNDVTCRPPTLIWYPSTPARMVKINSLPSTNGNGQVTSGFCSRPMNRLNHEVVLDSFESTASSRIHFSHLLYPSTAKFTEISYNPNNAKLWWQRKKNTEYKASILLTMTENYTTNNYKMQIKIYFWRSIQNSPSFRRGAVRASFRMREQTKIDKQKQKPPQKKKRLRKIASQGERTQLFFLFHFYLSSVSNYKCSCKVPI